MDSDGVREIVLAKGMGKMGFFFGEEGEKNQHQQRHQIHLARRGWIRDHVGSTGQ